MASMRYPAAAAALGLAFSPAMAADLTAPVPDAPLLSPTPVAAEPRLSWPAPAAGEPLWAAGAFIGASGGGHDLHELALRPWLADPGDYLWAGLSASRRVARFWTDFAVDLEVGAGRRFGPRFRASEAWAAAYVRYDGFPWNDRLYTTFAVSTGLNVIDGFPAEERRSDRRRSALLHYFSPELTFALPWARQHELVVRYHHRSGVFGTFNGVWGGSNVVAAGYRYRW